jgi:hypothetical protein
MKKITNRQGHVKSPNLLSSPIPFSNVLTELLLPQFIEDTSGPSDERFKKTLEDTFLKEPSPQVRDSSLPAFHTDVAHEKTPIFEEVNKSFF